MTEDYTHSFNLETVLTSVKGECYPKQLDVILKNYRVIVLQWKGSFKSFGPTPSSTSVKKLRPRHLLKLFYGRAKTKIMLILSYFK